MNAMRNVKKWVLFLQWWLMVSIYGVATYMLLEKGVFDAIKAVDWTQLCFIIIALFVLFTVKTGFISFLACKKGEKINYDELVLLSQKNEAAWFVSEKLLQLGMLGTVLGFIYALGVSFAGITGANANVIAAALPKFTGGMSVALYTTATALICGIALQVQTFNLSQYLDRKAAGCKLVCDT